MVRLRVSVGYMVLMIAGAVLVEGALVALPSLLAAVPTQAAPAELPEQYFVEVRHLSDGRLSMEMRASN